jgi:tetratricopeptide (TPR) repeat protein
MKKSAIKFFTVILVMTMFSSFIFSGDAIAAKKKKKLTPEEITQMTNTASRLVKKVYSYSLFSPKDNESLIDLKIKLDDYLPTNTTNPDFPALYYRVGYVYEQREYKDDAIDCFKTILENFPDSPFTAKASNELKKMGVKIENPAASTTGP